MSKFFSKLRFPSTTSILYFKGELLALSSAICSTLLRSSSMRLGYAESWLAAFNGSPFYSEMIIYYKFKSIFSSRIDFIMCVSFS